MQKRPDVRLFNMMLKATHPRQVNNVMTLEGFHTYTEPLMRSLGVIGTRKFIQDVHLIKNIHYCLHELGNIFVLFPEARYSLDGCTSFLPDSLGKMVRLMKVPVAVLSIHGNFITCPQWNKKNKKTYVEGEVKPILTAEEIKKLSADEINQRIRVNLFRRLRRPRSSAITTVKKIMSWSVRLWALKACILNMIT